jgi:RNA polymerase sigma-70 factor (ECF subfamily)
MAGELESLADIDLLRRFQRGEILALAELAKRHELSLLGMASGLLDGRQDLARDCVQDCWLRVIKYGKGFDGRASFKTWLYRMVINRSRDLRRRHRVVSLNGSAGHGHGSAAGELEASWSAGESVPIGTSGRNEAIDGEALGRAVGRLPEGTRLIVLLCYHRGMTHEAAAEILGIPVGTLKSRLHAGLNELRDALGTKTGERS